ncbi:AAA family ATPase [Flavobacterium filum]|uniref:AAA family ATPase n=1 Tax=Flavobacterium filum TaxID=370974 RepID=UPI0023F54EF9|nr:AAA family ATPase [Flavobacterium filum]
MIIGAIVRNIKTYSGINYIPLTFGQTFSGLVGNNGIGKSSVLEALDSFFNGRQWNHNIITKKSGFTTTRPHIVPLFMIDIGDISSDNLELAKKLSDYIWQLEESDILSQNRDQFKTFSEQLSIIKREHNQENTLLLPLGFTHDNTISLSFFNTKKLGELLITDFDKSQQSLNDEEVKQFESIVQELKSLIEYIYIPKDIDPENFAQLETKEIQSLMGETLTEIVEKCVPQSKIQEINQNLNTFIDNLSTVLEDYSFRTIGERQVNLRKHDVYKLIVEAYFKIRKLHKKEGSHWLEMSVLSSGEKQKAIIELAYHFLKSYRDNTKKIVLAIDEPESSLHMSACYDQFNKLFEVSLLCKQLLFTTHWYGFIPTVEDGCVSVITKTDKSHLFDLVSVSSYREEVKQAIKSSKGKLPYDIRLKSINDFTQSVVTSILTNEPYNWLICEGSSEKIYFEKYFADIKKEKKLRIIPVGGASEIKRIYNNLQVAYEDFKKEIQGKVILVSDTDTELVQYPTRDDLKNLLCYRIVNTDKDKKTILVKIESNPISPKTEIEDALNGKLFFETLVEFRDAYPELENIIKDINEPLEVASYYALDLSPSKQQILDNFFNADNNKFDFANKYVTKLTDAYQIPDWIDNLKKLY